MNLNRRDMRFNAGDMTLEKGDMDFNGPVMNLDRGDMNFTRSVMGFAEGDMTLSEGVMRLGQARSAFGGRGGGVTIRRGGKDLKYQNVMLSLSKHLYRFVGLSGH